MPMRIATFGASLLLLCGCAEQTAVREPSTYIDQHHPNTIVLERGRLSTRVHQPRLNETGDTIIGDASGQPVRIAIADVTRATVSKTDWETTGLIIVALVAAGVAVDLPGQFSKGKSGQL